MKRFFTFLLIVLGASTMLYSQVTMTKASHGFFVGQSHECQAVQYQAPGESGLNCVWDFSKVILLKEDKSVADLSDDNYGTGPLRVNRNDGCEFFFNTTEYVNEYLGYKAGNSKLEYTEPIVKTKYPQTYNTQFSGKYKGTYSIEGSNYTYNLEGTYSTHVDGSGIILLPGDVSFPAIRVRTTEATPTFERVKYLWYAQNVRLPLFVVLEDYYISADGTRTLKTTLSYLNVKADDNPTGIQSPLADSFSYQVFPNPFVDKIQVSYSINGKALVNIALFSANGTQLATLVSNQLQSGDQSISQDVSKYTQQAGVYLLKLTIGDKTYTEKIVKAY